MTGAFMAAGLSGKVALLEDCIRLLGYLSDRLKYLAPSVLSLLEGACASRQFEALAFPRRCRELTGEGLPFPIAWRKAVEENRSRLGDEEAGILAGLADVLGCADLESQLASIRYTRELLMIRLEHAREREKTYSKLYRTLGVLSGLAVAVLIL